MLTDADLADLAELDLSECEIVVLARVYFDQWGLRRISAEIGVPRTTVRRVMYRAAAKVRAKGFVLPARQPRMTCRERRDD